MNIALRKPRMSREQFFAWAEAQDGRYEFDGFQPVAMTGGTFRHNRITLNIQAALRSRLQSGQCQPFGPDAGVRTVGETVRYPDAGVTCSKVDDAAREVPGMVVVFEVLSPTSGNTDRIIKLLEYRAVASIRRDVIVEHGSAAVTVHWRDAPGAEWSATALTADAVLPVPEVGIDIPVMDFFAATDLVNVPETGGSEVATSTE